MTSGPGVRISVRLDDDARIADMRFETAAFPAARPVASALCRSLLGATVAQAAFGTAAEVALTGGVPEGSAVARTVHFARSAAMRPLVARFAADAAPVCTCFHVSEDAIRAAVREHRLLTVHEVKDRTRAACGCGSCYPEVARIVAEEAARGRRT